MTETTWAWYQTSTIMSLKRKSSSTFKVRKRQQNEVPRPKRYECPKGNAILRTGGRRIKIHMLLDSGSNIFLLNPKLVQEAKIPYATRPAAVKIKGFDGAITTRGGKHFIQPIVLEIGLNSHRSEISCEVADAGKYDLIIPAGWCREHPLSDWGTPETWRFSDRLCDEHVLDEGISDMWEYDESVVFEEEARIIGQVQ